MTTIALYKPAGILSSFTGEPGQTTLSSFVSLPGIYAAGRLDMDSEGLLILSDDGVLIHRLTDPRHHQPKTYFVQVEGEPGNSQVQQLESGVWIKDRKTRKCKVMKVPPPDLPERAIPITPHGLTSWLKIVLHEGMKRQIRHMTAAVGLPTLRLVRIAIGRVNLDGLLPGEWRHLTQSEIESLSNLASQSSQV